MLHIPWSRSNPFSAVQVLKERSKLLRKAVYTLDEDWKKHMPEKNMGDDLQKEIAYCKALETAIEADQTLREIPAVKEKLNLLKETVEDTKDNFILSKDADAKRRDINRQTARFLAIKRTLP